MTDAPAPTYTTLDVVAHVLRIEPDGTQRRFFRLIQKVDPSMPILEAVASVFGREGKDLDPVQQALLTRTVPLVGGVSLPPKVRSKLTKADKLAAARRVLEGGESQKAVADDLGVSQASVGRWCKGLGLERVGRRRGAALTPKDRPTKETDR